MITVHTILFIAPNIKTAQNIFDKGVKLKQLNFNKGNSVMYELNLDSVLAIKLYQFTLRAMTVLCNIFLEKQIKELYSKKKV